VKSRLALVMACCLGLGACSSMHAPHIWPFYKKPQPAPEVVLELDLVNADGTPASYPQFWKRNTLVIDLSGVSGAGSMAARLPDGSTWPVRVAVRVRPGSVQQIEVRGEERNVMPVAADGSLPIDLEFAPSVFRRSTAALYIAWGPMPQFAEAPAPPPDPGFVSPTQVPSHAEPATPDSEAPAPGASEIVPPSEVAQPSPPPGS
jgi:hypothetical protein